MNQITENIYPLDPKYLEETIGYTFKNRHFLTEALTHSSYANEMRSKSGQQINCNERS